MVVPFAALLLLFKVICTAPFNPKEPYNAEAAAPFNTEIFSISSELIFHISVVVLGTPSITIKGFLPLKYSLGSEKKSLLFVTVSPATFPVRDSTTLGEIAFCRASPFTS
ncbi:hypothetical protein D3C85_1174800 [compost metagenome]